MADRDLGGMVGCAGCCADQNTDKRDADVNAWRQWLWQLPLAIVAGCFAVFVVTYQHADHLVFAPHRTGYLPSSELITITDATADVESASRSLQNIKIQDAEKNAQATGSAANSVNDIKRLALSPDMPFSNTRTSGARDSLAIKAYFLPPAKENGPVILFNHGYNTDISDLLTRAHQANAKGYGVMLYDYPSYGLSRGRLSEQSCYRSALAVYDYLVRELQYRNDQIVVYGHSLGAAMALELALQRPVRYLVLDSPFVSAFRVLTRWQVVPSANDKFDNLSKIAKLPHDCRLEIRYSREDELIGCWHSKELHAASLGNVLVANGVKQNDGVAGENVAKNVDASKTYRMLVERVGRHDAYQLDLLPGAFVALGNDGNAEMSSSGVDNP